MADTARSTALEPGAVAEVRALAARAAGSDGVAALSEAFVLALTRERAGAVHLVRHADDGTTVGYAQVASVGSPDAVAELVVDPSARRDGHGRALLEATLADGAHSVWAHGDLDPARALASSAGLERTRSLHRMVRPLTGADATDPVLPKGYSVRAFEPGRDEEGWIRLNAAAFAGHREQGRLTVEDLHERMAQPWFDPAGFLLVERDGRVVAFHWTKVGPDGGTGSSTGRAPEPGTNAVRSGIGEVYVVGVDPAEQGHGLGGPLTGLGLAHLARLGLDEVELYVDGDNPAARRTYARLGFEDAAVDVQYSVNSA